MAEQPHGGPERYEPPAGEAESAAADDPAAAPAPAESASADPDGLDLGGMDLEALRTVEHPVLSELVRDLRERVAAPGSEALWGFTNSM